MNTKIKFKDRINRRDFMGKATAAIGVVIGAALAIPAVAYVMGPALQDTTEEEWIRLGSTSKVALGSPTLFKVNVERQTGWIVDQRELSFYVLTEDGRNYVAMSNICTHLGCRVRWIDDQEQFFCPCHNAAFDKAGEVLNGPPPRPLDQYAVKVEDDQLFVLGG